MLNVSFLWKTVCAKKNQCIYNNQVLDNRRNCLEVTHPDIRHTARFVLAKIGMFARLTEALTNF